MKKIKTLHLKMVLCPGWLFYHIRAVPCWYPVLFFHRIQDMSRVKFSHILEVTSASLPTHTNSLKSFTLNSVTYLFVFCYMVLKGLLTSWLAITPCLCQRILSFPVRVDTTNWLIPVASRELQPLLRKSFFCYWFWNMLEVYKRGNLHSFTIGYLCP